MLSPWRNSSAIKLTRNSVLLSHHAAGGEPEDGKAARKALSQNRSSWYGFCRTGVVMDWRNKSDEIYFNHFYYNKTTKTACFTRRTTLRPLALTKKKNSSSANTWVLVNKNPAPCYSPTVKFAVPSPLRSLTTVFGKGTCVTTSLWAPEKNQIKKIKSIKPNIRTICCNTFFTYTPEKGNMRKKVVKPHDI